MPRDWSLVMQLAEEAGLAIEPAKAELLARQLEAASAPIRQMSASGLMDVQPVVAFRVPKGEAD
jgi:hypothetical protein